MIRFVLAIAAALPLAAAAAAPTLKDFRRGLLLTPEEGRPLQELLLPDDVYVGVTRSDLGDLRVFNAGGVVVPHALCTDPASAPNAVGEDNLPVFELQRAGADGTPGTRVDIQTAEGTAIRVEEPAADATSPPTPQTAGYVMDARGLPNPIRALRVLWQTADGASEVHVRVEASDDLDQWRTIVGDAALLRVRGASGTLERVRIPLPESRYAYLRLQRNDGGPPPIVSEVGAEWVRAPDAPQPMRFMTNIAGAANGDAFIFDAARLAPVHAAWVQLPMVNMSLRVALDSRTESDRDWQNRWTGNVDSVGGQDKPHGSFASTTDRHWRLRVLKGAESLGGGAPMLELGYHPARLRFLTQGDAPFTLAYGSRRAAPAQSETCDGLLAQVAGSEGLPGQAMFDVAPQGRFGGEAALTVPVEPPPVRRMVLWGVLILGSGLLIWMSRSLLHRLRVGN